MTVTVTTKTRSIEPVAVQVTPVPLRVVEGG